MPMNRKAKKVILYKHQQIDIADAEIWESTTKLCVTYTFICIVCLLAFVKFSDIQSDIIFDNYRWIIKCHNFFITIIKCNCFRFIGNGVIEKFYYVAVR